MTFVQKLSRALLPKSWGDSIEAESRRWTLQCPCGHEISVWDAGGIRWKAVGKPYRYWPCPECGWTWHRTYLKPEADQAEVEDRIAS